MYAQEMECIHEINTQAARIHPKLLIITEETKILGEKWSDSWKKLETGTTALLSQWRHNFAR